MKRINWKTTWLVVAQWVIFTMILSTLAIILLVKDRNELRKGYEGCMANWEPVMAQLESGRIILELK